MCPRTLTRSPPRSPSQTPLCPHTPAPPHRCLHLCQIAWTGTTSPAFTSSHFCPRGPPLPAVTPREHHRRQEQGQAPSAARADASAQKPRPLSAEPKLRQVWLNRNITTKFLASTQALPMPAWAANGMGLRLAPAASGLGHRAVQPRCAALPLLSAAQRRAQAQKCAHAGQGTTVGSERVGRCSRGPCK